MRYWTVCRTAVYNLIAHEGRYTIEYHNRTTKGGPYELTRMQFEHWLEWMRKQRYGYLRSEPYPPGR